MTSAEVSRTIRDNATSASGANFALVVFCPVCEVKKVKGPLQLVPNCGPRHAAVDSVHCVSKMTLMFHITTSTHINQFW